jgi:hypothetical protein
MRNDDCTNAKLMPLSRPEQLRVHRRHFLGAVGGLTAAALTPGAARAATSGQWSRLVDRAMAAYETHKDRLVALDRFAVVDFTLPSATPRMLLVDRKAGSQRLLRVAHGRGSDPEHSGWLRSFSNTPSSNASSRGAYATGSLYMGKHGQSQRLIGLDDSNNSAEARAIVIHGAWYCNPEVLQETGKLGRSEGCFAVSEGEIGSLLEWLGPGRLLYADKL